MHRKKLVWQFFFLLFCYSYVTAQSRPSKSEKLKTVTLSGFVRDAITGETLTGAIIYPKEKSYIGISSNSYGYFSLSISSGIYSIVVQYLGYKTKNIALDLKNNDAITIDMEEESIALKEVTITGEKNNNNVVSTEVMNHAYKLENKINHVVV